MLHGIKLCVCLWFRGFCGRRSSEKLSLTPPLPSDVSLYQVCIRMNAWMNWLKIKMRNFYGYNTAIRAWEIDRPIRQQQRQRQQQQHKGNKIYIWLLCTVFICMYISCQQDATRLTNEQQTNKIIDRDGRDTDCHSHSQSYLQVSKRDFRQWFALSFRFRNFQFPGTPNRILYASFSFRFFFYKFSQSNTFSNSIFQTEKATYLRR